MQQPLPVPDDYDDEFDEFEEFTAPAVPSRTPEEIAEQSAFEVFPGGAAGLDANEWWQQVTSVPDLAEPPSGGASEPTVEPLTLPRRQTPPAEVRTDWIGARKNDLDEGTATPSDEPEPMWTEPEAELEEEFEEAFEDDEPVEFSAEPEPYAPPSALNAPPPVRAPADDELPRSVLSLPLLSGREQRAAAGASQRAAILAQAGAPLIDDEDDLSGGGAQLAVAMQRKDGAPAQAAAKATPRRGFLTRKIALSLFIIALGIAALSGGAVASGQGAEVERVASSLTPDVLERWISDRVSSLGSTSTPVTSTDDGSQPADVPVVADNQSLFGVIANTGGTGVAVRSACIPEARTPGTIAEGARVTVIARGVGDCTGWNVVRAGSAVSWVEAAYIAPAP